MTMTSQSESARDVATAARPASVPTSPVKLPGPCVPNNRGALNGLSCRLDRSGKNGKHSGVPIALRIKNIVRFELASLAVSLQYRQLRFVERGIHLMVAAAA